MVSFLELSNTWHIPKFANDSMLRFDDVPNLSVHTITDIDIWMKPTNPDGLVLYWGHIDSRQKKYVGGDFVALVLIAWIPHFYWNLGSGVAFVKYALLYDRRQNRFL